MLITSGLWEHSGHTQVWKHTSPVVSVHIQWSPVRKQIDCGSNQLQEVTQTRRVLLDWSVFSSKVLNRNVMCSEDLDQQRRENKCWMWHKRCFKLVVYMAIQSFLEHWLRVPYFCEWVIFVICTWIHFQPCQLFVYLFNFLLFFPLLICETKQNTKWTKSVKFWTWLIWIETTFMELLVEIWSEIVKKNQGSGTLKVLGNPWRIYSM